VSASVTVVGELDELRAAILTPDALALLGELHRRFEPRRRALLATRAERQAGYDRGERPCFRDDTAEIREQSWSVAPAPPALARRWVEITGPTAPKMLINALNSGATGFMADFEDANTPTWSNMVDGQVAIAQAVAGTIEHRAEDGRVYSLRDETATLLVRPRGWHLLESRVLVDGEPLAGAFFDFALHLLHNGPSLVEQGAGPFFYLPKMEQYEEALLWDEAFRLAQDAAGLPHGTIKATALIETLPAAFEMDEILYALRDHSAGLNAGRWDYIFSAIKVHRDDPAANLPDRASVTMTVPFMRAYTELLVATCHRRGAHAMGGMAALIPSRRDADATERALAGVRADKEREVTAGFDGTWVAHPDLVPTAMTVFEQALGERDNQLERRRDDVDVSEADLLDLRVQGAQVTQAGVRANVRVAVRYLASWLSGSGAAAIDGLMEDVATAEISRAQLWHWVRHAALVEGEALTAEAVSAIGEEEAAALGGPLSGQALELLREIALGDELPTFLTPAATRQLP